MTAVAKAAQEAVPRDSDKWVTISALIKRLNPVYVSVEITAIYKLKRRVTTYKAFVSGKGSGFCSNYGRDHRSAKVYFEICQRGITQLCWCRCDTEDGRIAGRCRSYKSEPFALSRTDIKVLFETPTGWGMVFSDSAATTHGSSSLSSREKFMAASSTKGKGGTRAIVDASASRSHVSNSGTTSASKGTTDAAAFTPAVSASLFFESLKQRQGGITNFSTHSKSKK